MIEEGDAGLRYRFTHAIVRSSLLDGLSRARRVALQRRVEAAAAAHQDGGDHVVVALRPRSAAPTAAPRTPG